MSSTLICGCPPAAAITAIPTEECLLKIRQVQGFGVQRTRNAGVLNEIDISTDNPNLLATWTALKAAADSTKVQFSPFVAEPTSEAGEARTYGGGNQTLNGLELTLGRAATPFSCKLLDTYQNVVKALKSYECEAALSVFLLTELGAIVGLVDDHDTPTKFRGIPIQSFFVSDLTLGGYEAPEQNMVSWSFLANWSDYLYQVAPADFDALTQL